MVDHVKAVPRGFSSGDPHGCRHGGGCCRVVGTPRERLACVGLGLRNHHSRDVEHMHRHGSHREGGRRGGCASEGVNDRQRRAQWNRCSVCSRVEWRAPCDHDIAALVVREDKTVPEDGCDVRAWECVFVDTRRQLCKSVLSSFGCVTDALEKQNKTLRGQLCEGVRMLLWARCSYMIGM